MSNRREFIKKTGLGTIAVAATAKMYAKDDNPVNTSTKNKATPQKPNIIYINSHDTGRYIQPFGHAIPTPNLQKLADEGVLFRQFFTTNPTSSASRASLLTGMYPHCNGMIGLAHRGFKLNDYSQHLLHTLRKEGYVTALAGVQHVASHTEGEPWKTTGFDENICGTHDTAEMKKLLSWIENAPENPFYLEVGFVETHRKFPPANWKDKPANTLPPSTMSDTNEVRLDMTQFKESARILDEKMGMVFDTLSRVGLMENTLIICTTDHGLAFPLMKCNLTDGGIGIFLIMHGPRGFTGGKVVDSMISNVDIFPTICEYLAIPSPAWIQGKSFLPVIRGEKEEINEEIFGEVNYHAAYEPMRCVRTKKYKYIRRFDKREKPVLSNIDDSPSKTEWLNAGYADIPLASEQLYDLILDPNEKNNLIGHPSYKGVTEQMRNRLKNYMETTHDPLTKGFIAAPAGAKVNRQESVSPNEETVTI